jgi:hypothetical protein
MSFPDKVNAAVSPAGSGADRARANATAPAQHGDWLSVLLQHHLAMEEVLAKAEVSREEEERRIAFAAFSIFLTGHEIVEDSAGCPGPSAYSEIGEFLDPEESRSPDDRHMATGCYAKEFDLVD